MNVSMPQTLGLTKVTFHLPETSVQTQCILLKGLVPSNANFEFIISATDLNSLNFNPTPSDLTALVYEFPLAESEIQHLIVLFQLSNCEYLFFSDSSKALNSYFALALKKDMPASQPLVQSPRFLLFECGQDELFFDDSNNHKNLIRVLKKNKHIFIQNALSKNRELEASIEETSALTEIIDFLQNRIKFLREEIENSKLGVKQMEFQVSKKRAQVEERKKIDLNCKSCTFGQKSSAFVPCGHILFCTSCAIQLFNSKTSEKICQVCQVPVTDYNYFKLL